MELHNQVTNLELSKKLFKLGVKQESYFYWHNPNGLEMVITETEQFRRDCECPESYAAFTVAELGKMLPSYYKIDGIVWMLNCTRSMKTNGYVVMYKESKRKGLSVRFYSSYKEADARAKMLIYLLENKFLKVPK